MNGVKVRKMKRIFFLSFYIDASILFWSQPDSDMSFGRVQKSLTSDLTPNVAVIIIKIKSNTSSPSSELRSIEPNELHQTSMQSKGFQNVEYAIYSSLLDDWVDGECEIFLGPFNAIPLSRQGDK